MKIAGIDIAKGVRTSVDIRLPRLYTHDEMALSALVVRGRKPGPTLLVTAAIHGDEIIGIEIIHRLLDRKFSGLKGTLIAVPVVNVYGLFGRDRYLPDGRDLNRFFPGKSQGSLAARLAHALTSELLVHADAVVDLHSGARHRANLPQCRVCPGDEASHAMANEFGAPVILESAIREGSFRAAAAAQNTPVVVFEGGEALRHDAVVIRIGLAGVLNVMEHLGMVKPRRRKNPGTPYLARSASWVRAPLSGIVRFRARLGQQVRQGQRLCVVSDPFGEFSEEVLAPRDGIVIGTSRLPLIYAGEAICNVGSFEPEALEDGWENPMQEVALVDD